MADLEESLKQYIEQPAEEEQVTAKASKKVESGLFQPKDGKDEGPNLLNIFKPKEKKGEEGKDEGPNLLNIFKPKEKNAEEEAKPNVFDVFKPKVNADNDKEEKPNIFDVFKPKQKLGEDSSTNIVDTMGKIVQNPFDIGDAIGNLKEDLQGKTDKFNQDLKKTGDKIRNDFENIFRPKQQKSKNPLDALKESGDKFKEDLKEKGDKFKHDLDNIFKPKIKSTEKQTRLFPDPFHLKDKAETIKNDFKDKSSNSNIFENVHNKAKEITINLPDPIKLKDKSDEIKNIVKQTGEGENIFKNIQAKAKEITDNLSDPLNLKDKAKEIENVLKETGGGGDIFENIKNKAKEITDNLPDPLNLKDKAEEVKNVLKETSVNIQNKAKEITDNLPDPLNLKDKSEEYKTVLKETSVNLPNKAKDTLPDPLDKKKNTDKEDYNNEISINYPSTSNDQITPKAKPEEKPEVFIIAKPIPLKSEEIAKNFQQIITLITETLQKILRSPFDFQGNIKHVQTIVKCIDDNNKKIIAALPDPLNLKGQIHDVDRAFQEKGIQGGLDAIGKNIQILVKMLIAALKKGDPTVFNVLLKEIIIPPQEELLKNQLVKGIIEGALWPLKTVLGVNTL